MKFKDIVPIPGFGNYRCSVPLNSVEEQIQRWTEELGLQLEPDYQRGHVWTEEQQVKYVEFILRQGKSGRDILFNHTKWHDYQFSGDGNFECVDGLQRLTAILLFVRNQLKVFGHFYMEFEDPNRLVGNCLTFHVNDLQSRKQVLEWYLQLNDGGTVHSIDELNRVKALLEKEQKDDNQE